MNRHDREEELDEEYAIERIPRTNTPLMLIGGLIVCSSDAIKKGLLDSLPVARTQALIHALLLGVGEAPNDVVGSIDKAIYKKWMDFLSH